MYKECKTEKSVQRQYLIEDCLLQQMKKRDYEQIHISDICKMAGISRTAFYRYFDTKSDVLEAYLDRMAASFSDPKWYAHPTDDALADGTYHFIRFWYENREIIGLLFEQNLASLLIKKAVATSSGSAKIMQRTVMNSDKEAMRRATVFSAYGIFGVMYDWQKRGFKESEKELIEILKSLLLKPLYQIDDEAL